MSETLEAKKSLYTGNSESLLDFMDFSWISHRFSPSPSVQIADSTACPVGRTSGRPQQGSSHRSCSPEANLLVAAASVPTPQLIIVDSSLQASTPSTVGGFLWIPLFPFHGGNVDSTACQGSPWSGRQSSRGVSVPPMAGVQIPRRRPPGRSLAKMVKGVSYQTKLDILDFHGFPMAQ